MTCLTGWKISTATLALDCCVPCVVLLQVGAFSLRHNFLHHGMQYEVEVALRDIYLVTKHSFFSPHCLHFSWKCPLCIHYREKGSVWHRFGIRFTPGDVKRQYWDREWNFFHISETNTLKTQYLFLISTNSFLPLTFPFWNYISVKKPCIFSFWSEMACAVKCCLKQ